MSNELIPQLQEVKSISELLADVVRQAKAGLPEKKLVKRLLQVSVKNEGKGLSYAVRIIVDFGKNGAKLDEEINRYFATHQSSEIPKLRALNRYNFYYIGFDLFQKLSFCLYYDERSTNKNQKSAIDMLYKSLRFSEKIVKLLDDEKDSEHLSDYLEPSFDRKELFEDSLLLVLHLFNTFITESLFDKLRDFNKALTSQQRTHHENQLNIIEAILKNTTLALTMIKASAYGKVNDLSPDYQEIYCEIAGMHADALRARGLFYALCETKQADALDDLLDAYTLYDKIEQTTLQRIAICRDEDTRGEMLELIKDIKENKTICRKHTDRLQQNSGDLDTVERVLTVLSRSDRRGKRVLPMPASNKEDMLKRRKIEPSEEGSGSADVQARIGTLERQLSNHSTTKVRMLFNGTSQATTANRNSTNKTSNKFAL